MEIHGYAFWIRSKENQFNKKKSRWKTMKVYKTRAWFMAEKEGIKYEPIREYIDKNHSKETKPYLAIASKGH